MAALIEEASRDQIASARLHDLDLLGASFTRLDLHSLLAEAGEKDRPDAGSAPLDTLSRLASPDANEARTALSEVREWDQEHIAQLPRIAGPGRSL